MREKTCCFTGHRRVPIAGMPAILSRTEALIRQMVQKGVTDFYTGGALGYDTLAAKLLFDLRDMEFPHIRVILVYPFDGYTNRWTDTQIQEHEKMLPRYDKIVNLSQEASRNAYLQRDRYLVDCSGYCICYCTRKFGGTAYTVRYALQQGLKVTNTTDFDISTV